MKYTHDLVPDWSKHFVGFDRVFDHLNDAATKYTKAAANWPPYNIVKTGENTYAIELAVAGLAKHNIDIELANNTLVVKGGSSLAELDPIDNPVEYLYKGIADRFFTRTFTLNDTVEVKNAQYINGILKIFLENVIPEDKEAKKVDID
jgi:molecular chaperone IbpA